MSYAGGTFLTADNKLNYSRLNIMKQNMYQFAVESVCWNHSQISRGSSGGSRGASQGAGFLEQTRSFLPILEIPSFTMIHSKFHPAEHRTVPFPSSDPTQILEPRPVILMSI